MVKRSVFVISLIVFVLGFLLLNFATVYFFGIPLSPVAITGRAVETGYVILYVEGAPKVITIISPENVAYNEDNYTCVTGSLPKCDNNRYYLPVNVSADFLFEDEGDPWRYTLYDLKHEEYIVEARTSFTSGNLISFVRWDNLLTVFSESVGSDWVNQSVVFAIDVPDSAPLIQSFTEKIFVCETEDMSSLSASFFNVWDLDEEDFNVPGRVIISPTGGVFSIKRFPSKIDRRTSKFQIASVTFNKSHLQSYIETIDVTDSTDLVASNVTNITVIEINNPPVLYNNGVIDTDGIGAQTVHKRGVGSVFSYQMDVRDVEDGDSDDENLTFSLSSGGLNVDFNTSTGVMNYTYVEDDSNDTYSITVCAEDNALASVHENFSVCSGKGHSSDSIVVCDDFTLDVTSVNRAPTIDSHSPSGLSFDATGTISDVFTVTVSDDDMIGGSSPDIDWYVDDVFIEGDENVSSYSFSYSFDCGVSGIHNVTIITSDGLANDSLTWTVNVAKTDCAVVSLTNGGGSSGGGGGSLGGACSEIWSCLDWGVCQNAERSFDARALSLEDFSSVKDLCFQNEYDERFCGFQITRCVDLRACNNTEFRVPKPAESRVCYFTENPSCIDGITNCHDDSCELLVDCGGPCDPCPTCSDGERNQGEKGVDCGGPCPFSCEAERPFGATSFILIGLVAVLFIVAMFIIIKLVSILRYRFFLSGKRGKGKKR